ncbi:MAG: signal transduction histidine kinase [Chlamydiales bacterium]|jgi:signal transduction histidine kinase
MTETTDLLVAHIAHPTSSPSALAQALDQLSAEVRHFCDPSETLNQLPLSAEVVFLVERSALTGGGMMWLILLAEARRGPIVLIEDERDRDPGAALRAGVQSVVFAADFHSAIAVENLVVDAFDHFERRATNRTVRWDGVLPNRSSATRSRAGTVDPTELRAYLRDSMNEFRTPLTAVVEFASLLGDGLAGPLNEKQSDYTSYILEACAELLELHGDFRQSAGLRLGGNPERVESFGLIHAIEEALIGVRTTRVTFRIDANDEAVRVKCERNALVMVVARLAQRAAKCSTRDSEIVIRMRAVAGVKVEVAVIDNGPVPTEGDIRLLDEGTVRSGDLSKSVTQVFGIGIELARAVLLRQGTPLELSATADCRGQLAFSLPIVAA